MDADLAFDCPRCRRAVTERYYGVCSSCRDDLRLRVAGRARSVETERFEPVMHVTPNAVALKED